MGPHYLEEKLFGRGMKKSSSFPSATFRAHQDRYFSPNTCCCCCCCCQPKTNPPLFWHLSKESVGRHLKKKCSLKRCRTAEISGRSDAESGGVGRKGWLTLRGNERDRERKHTSSSLRASCCSLPSLSLSRPPSPSLSLLLYQAHTHTHTPASSW